MLKRITVDYHYHAIDFDDELESLVNTMVDAYNREEAAPRKAENLYDRIYVQSTECEGYAERALEILIEKFPRYQFAAHSDATAFPANSYWRILATTESRRAINKEQMRKIRAAATRILKNVEAKYPEIKQLEKKSTPQGLWGTILDIFAP